MSTLCKTCHHPDRAKIELGLATKVPARTLAKKFGLSPQSIFRHKRKHMPPQLKAALLKAVRPTAIDLEKLKHDESEGLLQHLVSQRARLYLLGDMAQDMGDIRAAAAVHGRLTANLELTGRLIGELRTASVTVTQNILLTPQYHVLRSALIQALRPFADARKAVAQVLHSIESKAVDETPAAVE